MFMDKLLHEIEVRVNLLADIGHDVPFNREFAWVVSRSGQRSYQFGAVIKLQSNIAQITIVAQC